MSEPAGPWRPLSAFVRRAWPVAQHIAQRVPDSDMRTAAAGVAIVTWGEATVRDAPALVNVGVLADGAAHAREIAAPIMDSVRRAVGLR